MMLRIHEHNNLTYFYSRTNSKDDIQIKKPLIYLFVIEQFNFVLTIMYARACRISLDCLVCINRYPLYLCERHWHGS